MIARVWHGTTLADKAKPYLTYLARTGARDCQATPGNRGVWILHRTRQERTEFLFVSFWESYADIARFAGEDIRRARYYPEDGEFLLQLEPEVRHYEVSAGD